VPALPAGDVAAIDVALLTVTEDASVVPNLTEMTLVKWSSAARPAEPKYFGSYAD
jgi:hypothetical protein